NTPLIRLQSLAEETGCEILGKAEFMNPGGSVKDRTALGILAAAERKGALRPGGTVVEGTAGNTGIAIACLCHARGYRAVIVMPDNQSPEKYQALDALGAELHRVKAVPYADPNHYQRVAARIAAETPGAVWADQFDNTANRDAHYATTGPEILRDTNGRIHAFVAATGTGGTLGGAGRYLKEHVPAVRIVLADPQGSSLFHWVTSGELKANGPGSITEGIGIGRVTANLAGTPIDRAIAVSDREAVEMVYRLLYGEGLLLGSASGVNVAAALAVARELGPGHTVVTILCDGGQKYQSRLYSHDWLTDKNLADAADAGRALGRARRSC
ncbi:MAG TPA: cysteine synthase A, partial [Steroidobacteraceae bacterium]|nr:cysteine synthase A [Steroidobacteraceae bacterium]